MSETLNNFAISCCITCVGPSRCFFLSKRVKSFTTYVYQYLHSSGLECSSDTQPNSQNSGAAKSAAIYNCIGKSTDLSFPSCPYEIPLPHLSTAHKYSSAHCASNAGLLLTAIPFVWAAFCAHSSRTSTRNHRTTSSSSYSKADFKLSPTEQNIAF